MVDQPLPSGNAGTLLLDPNDITISGPHTSTPAPSPPPPTAAPNYDFSPSDETATIAVATIEDQLALGHVRVMSNVASNGPGGGLITVQDPISWTSSYALALEADSSIAVNANISGPAGALALIAKGAGTITQAPGTGNPAQLAHGISIALYNTAFGLIIAIPALIFWRYFRARVDEYLLTLELAGERLLQHLATLRATS